MIFFTTAQSRLATLAWYMKKKGQSRLATLAWYMKKEGQSRLATLAWYMKKEGQSRLATLACYMKKEGQSRLATLACYMKKEGQSRLATLAWYSPSFFMVMAMAGAEVPEPAALLREASEYIAARETTQFDMVMNMEFRDGTRETTAEITGSIALGKGSDAKLQLKAGNEEVVVYNNSSERHVFFPIKNTFQELTSEPDRARLLRSAISGPLKSSFDWLADFLHGAEFALEEAPTYAAGEIDEVPHYRLNMATSQYTLQAFLSKTTPPLLQRFDLELRGAALSAYTKTSEGFLRVTTEFTNWKMDEALPADMFKFTPPPGAKAESRASDRSQGDGVGQPAPDFSLPLLDGGTMKLSQHKGKDIVILDFWASWCGPCRQAMPIVVSVADRFKDKNVVLYAINLRETADKARSFLNQNNLSVAVPLDSGEVAAQYGVTGIPRMVIIGKDGLIKSIHGGMSPALEQKLTEEITELLN